MAAKPQFASKYKVVEALAEGLSFPVEVLGESAEELEAQKQLRIDAVKQTYGLYREKTELQYARRVEKLFALTNEEDIMKELMSDVAPSMTRCFRYRSYADLLEEKLALVKNPQYVKAIKIAIVSLREHGVIHPRLKEVISRILA